ncbi:hypothetical protein [Streptomyces sp. NPDC058579]|uniref:hypothetical protein n=1 Tax=Streptomyces sp. NPDC058579 TaxID=3346548 RepID=UPI003662B0E8
MTALAVRPLLSVAAASIALGAVALAGAPAAYAAPGDNGDIKIHREGTAEPNQSNHSRVCKFHFAAFNFDDLLSVHWEVVPENKVSPVKDGDIAINAEGDGFTADMELPDGKYRLEWSWVGQLGAKKSKNFTVKCLDDVTNPDVTPPPPNGGGENGGNGNGGNGSGWPGSTASASASATATATAPPPNNNGSNGGGNGGSGGSGSSGGSGWNGGTTGTTSDTGSTSSTGTTGTTGTENGGNGTTQKPPHKPPHGPVGAGGGGSADTTSSDDGSAFGVGAALAAGLAGTAGLILVRRNRRRTHGES